MLVDGWLYNDTAKSSRARRTKKLEPVSIRFDAQTLAELRQLAEEKGIGPTTLVRMWVLERLREQGANRLKPSKTHPRIY